MTSSNATSEPSQTPDVELTRLDLRVEISMRIFFTRSTRKTTRWY